MSGLTGCGKQWPDWVAGSTLAVQRSSSAGLVNQTLTGGLPPSVNLATSHIRVSATS